MNKLFTLILFTVVIGNFKNASAWVDFKNETRHTAFVSIAYNSIEGFLCGWDDGCRNGAKVQGHWKIEPGKTVRVSSKGYGNALWWFHATNTGGLVWAGTSPFQVQVDPINTFTNCSNIAKTTWVTKMFRNIRNTQCCGGTCPSNKTITLTES